MAKKKSDKLPISKLITCREFKKGLPKSEEVFVFPLPAPMEVGTAEDGSPMIATHCCLKDLDGNGAVECCFCTIMEDGNIAVFNLRNAEAADFSGYRGKSRSREIVN